MITTEDAFGIITLHTIIIDYDLKYFWRYKTQEGSVLQGHQSNGFGE